jgi:hypothetical protein
MTGVTLPEKGRETAAACAGTGTGTGTGTERTAAACVAGGE